MEHAWLGASSTEARIAQTVFEEIALEIRGLSTRTSADTWQRFVLSLMDQFKMRLESFVHCRELNEYHEQLRIAYEVEDDYECVREEVCIELLKSVRELYRRLRERLMAELDARAAQALVLGEWVDRVARPENVHRSMRVKFTLDQFPIVEEPFPCEQAATEVEETNYLAERVVAAGEILPSSFWPRQVLRLCAELGFTPEQTQNVTQLQNSMTPANVLSKVQQIDELIRRALARSGALPSWLRVDPANDTIYVDGTPHIVDDADLALFVQLVAARGGDTVSVAQLAVEDPRLKGFRPDKLLKRKRFRFIKQFICGGDFGYRLIRI